MQKVLRCDLCGGKSFKIILDGMTDRLHKADNNIFSLKECEGCGLVFVNPRISSPKEFALYYPGNYYSYSSSSKHGFADRAAIFLYGLFYDGRHKYNPLRLVLYPVSLFVRGTKIREGAKILDIGGGNGFFLDRMRSFGMQPFCIELGREGYLACKKKGIKVWDKEVFDARLKKNFFDVITINSVMEHVSQVKRTLAECHRILKKDGMIVVQVPNTKGFSSWFFGRYWAEWDVPRHLTNFNKSNLTRYIEEAGFEIVKVKNTGSHFQFTQSIKYWAESNGFGVIAKMAASKAVAAIFVPIVFLTDIFNVPGRIEIHAKKYK